MYKKIRLLPRKLRFHVRCWKIDPQKRKLNYPTSGSQFSCCKSEAKETGKVIEWATLALNRYDVLNLFYFMLALDHEAVRFSVLGKKVVDQKWPYNESLAAKDLCNVVCLVPPLGCKSCYLRHMFDLDWRLTISTFSINFSTILGSQKIPPIS